MKSAHEKSQSDDESRIDEESSSSGSLSFGKDESKATKPNKQTNNNTPPSTSSSSSSSGRLRGTTGRTGSGLTSEEQELKRVSAKKLIERYFYQLMQGCGNPKCCNKNCASSGKVGRLTPNAAAARAIQLFSQEAALCSETQPPKVAKTDEHHHHAASSSTSTFSSSVAQGSNEPSSVLRVVPNADVDPSNVHWMECNKENKDVEQMDYLDEGMLKELTERCVREGSDVPLIRTLGAVFSSNRGLAASFQFCPASSSIEKMLARAPAGDLRNMKKEDLRSLEGDLDKDEDSKAPVESTPDVPDHAHTTVDVESLRRSIKALYAARPVVFGPINNALELLGESLSRDLRVGLTTNDELESLVTVFVIAFETLLVGSAEFLEGSFPRICAAVSRLPVWAQCRLVRIWAEHCKDSIHPLLQQLQQLITITILSMTSFRHVRIHDNDVVCNATKAMKLVYYANILAGELEPKHYRESDLRDTSLPSYLSLIPEDDDVRTIDTDVRTRQKKLEDPFIAELDVNPLDCRKPLVPYEEFYNDLLCDVVEMDHDYLEYKSIASAENGGLSLLGTDPSKLFSFMQYSFILTPTTKTLALYYDSRIRMYSERRLSFLQQQQQLRQNSSALQAVNPYLNLKIRRDHIIDDALVELEIIAMSNPKDLKKQLVVEFTGEQGIDEGGVSKEFFQLIIEEIFNPDYGMFMTNEDSNTVWFNSISFENEAQFTLIGIVLGLAIYNNIILAVNFPMVVYRKLMGMKGSFLDLKDFNPVLFKSLKSLLDYTENDMEEVFMQTFKIGYRDVFGNLLEHELKPDGDKIFVTQNNKQDFVEQYSDFMLNKSVEKQFNAFRRGFQMVTDESPLHLLFRPEEVELIVCGSKEFDFDELEQSTEYEGGFTAESQTIKDFWSIVHGLSMEVKRKLLQFTTGSDRVPVGGLSRLKLVIARNGPDSDRLPTSHTCFNVLLLPEYNSKEKLEERLLKAINYSKGFGMLRADIFSVYPEILREILVLEELLFRTKSITAFGHTITASDRVPLQLPSEFEWQLKQYFRLLEQQKKINAATEQGIQLKSSLEKVDHTYWEVKAKSIDEVVSPMTSPASGDSSTPSFRRRRRLCILDNPIDFCDIAAYNQWRLEDIVRAGKLLHKPPLPVQFDDEYEMRKVYSMIYDVYRFKLVLQQALKNIGFYESYPMLAHETTRVWLLLYDMYLRKFVKREPDTVPQKDQLFHDAHLLEIERCLELNSIKIAAALTRIRIQNSAYNMQCLLPLHLQDNKVAVVVSNPIITGWINTFRIRTKQEANDILKQLGFELIEPPATASFQSLLNLFSPREKTGYIPLTINRYKWDRLCPQVLFIYPEDRSKFVQSQIFVDHQFIIQDRSFTIGPTVFSNLMDYFEVQGDVLQTHIASPRSTAYLATLLANCNRVRNFVAFGCGSKLGEYRKYMAELGVTNVKLFAEPFADIPHGSPIVDKVVGILANPPSSYSAVSDPIDLICSRGGDLSMLEMLSESEMTDDSRQRVSKLLEKQRETLKLAMSRPQVQFILYQTHSIVETENDTMVQRAVEYTNQKAFEVHYKAMKEREMAALAEAAGNTLVNRLLGRQQEAAAARAKNVDASDGGDRDGAEGGADGASTRKNSEEEVNVPPTDQFEVVEMPDFCPQKDGCLDFKECGVYLSLIRRREVIRLDSKYLIKIAELRGIFGDTNNEPRFNVKVAKRTDRKSEEQDAHDLQNRKKRLKRRGSNIDSLITRLNTPTQASLKRAHHHRMSSFEHKFMFFDAYREWCPKYANRSENNLSVLSDDRSSTGSIVRARVWWKTTIHYVIQKIRLSKLDGLDDSADFPPLLLRRYPAGCRLGIGGEDGTKRFRWSHQNRIPYPLPVRILEFRQYNSENSLLNKTAESKKDSTEKPARLSRQNALTTNHPSPRVRLRSSQSC
uniref:Ubiquitin-protein ligase E3A n=1 Tax=Anopheles christyi TaxID=43041 RepID=A0A182JNV3_9DIPT